MSVSSTVVAVGALGQLEIVYRLETAGVKVYQTLRDTFVIESRHDGFGGSPVLVADVILTMVVE
jgi:hypothetical protein